MKPGIVIIAEIHGDLAARIHRVQQRYDPRLAAELPPHITLTGSSGMGPIDPKLDAAEVSRVLAPIAASTAPITVQFGPPMQFMQSEVVVLPIEPHGPIRVLHERIKTSGLSHERPRFAFTPPCTLSFYPELSRRQVQQLLTERFPEPFVIDRIEAYRTETLTRTVRLCELALGSIAAPTGPS